MPKERTKKRREDFDSQRFTSGDAELRYEKTFLMKSLIPERGFHNPGGLVERIINDRDWHYFTQTPSAAVAPLVREFYANLPENRDDKVYVRGKWVKFDSSSINQLYRLHGIDVDQYQLLLGSQIDYDLILSFLSGGNPSVSWKRKDNIPVNFPSSGLSSVSKAWHYFITARLMPSGNVSEVTRDRVILNYCIQIDHTIDIGKVIRRSILNSISASVAVGLGHPSLIHELCVSQGVSILPHEEVHHPKSAITKEKISFYSSHLPFESGASPNQPSSSRASSRSKSLSLSDRIGRLEGKIDNLCQCLKEHNKWHEKLDARLAHYMEQQIEHYEYVADFNTAMGQVCANCGLNRGINFPEPPIYSSYKGPADEDEDEDEGADEDYD